jgi:hypothetical protein
MLNALLIMFLTIVFSFVYVLNKLHPCPLLFRLSSISGHVSRQCLICIFTACTNAT